MEFSTNYRTKPMNEFSEADINSIVKIAGWVENIRDHGGVSFIDLRDMYGVMQVVMRDTTLLDGISKEDCLSIEGIVEKRDEDTINPKIATGTIEVEAKSVTTLGKVRQPLPFEIQTSKEIREDKRLQYRFLDLRNEKVKDNIIFRSKVIAYLRQVMSEMGFLEMQTPILCASSPEGARDYVVPSRVHKGKFYALPQAPQQYKQLLMVSGIDKYFQVAPCCRDEDARADRSPGEFYQLDFEMAFATQEDVFKVGEEVLTKTFEKFAPKGYSVTKAPYPVISYKESMLKYGTDKPDLRNPLEIVDVTEFFQRCTFKPFHGQTVRAIKVHADISKGKHEKLLKFAQSIQYSLLLMTKLKLANMQAKSEQSLAKCLTFLKRTHIVSALSTTSLCLNIRKKKRKSDLLTIRFQCRGADLKRLKMKTRFQFLLISMILFATVLNFHQAQFVTTILIL